MKLLGIDYGENKVGLSLSSGQLAMPWQTLANKGTAGLIQELKDIVKIETIEKVVVGLPKGLQGNVTQQTKKVEEFYQALSNKLKVPVVFVDESFSTKLALRQGAGDDDAQAAANILQSYLDKFNVD